QVELLALAPSARVLVIPPSPPPLNQVALQSISANTVLFSGNFIHPPNVDAAMRLATSIFPLVLRRNPEAVLQLVGDAPPDELRRLAGPNIQVTGRVPHMRPYLEGAAVVVAPLRMGGGIRIKVIDALYNSKPTIASTLAAEGLDISPGEEIL